MPARLTAKQEAFAVAVAKGMNASDAYRNAFDTKGMKPASVNREAKRLIDNPKIATRLDRLRAPGLKAAQVGVDTWMTETAKYALAKPSKTLKHPDKRGYLDMLGRSLGTYAKDNAQQKARESLVLVVEQATPVKR